MKNWKWLYAVLLGGFTVACAKDLGNYDYRELVEPEIAVLEAGEVVGEAGVSVLALERLQLTVELGGEFPEERYAFEWKAIDTESDEEAVVIGTERALDCEVKLAEGSYVLYFTVTERASGLYWQASCALQVSQATSEGWLVLCSDGGRTRLDVVSAVTGETYRDILKDNGMPQWNGPRRIQRLGNDLTDEASPFYLFTDEGATRLGKSGFEWKEEYLLQYEMGSGAAPLSYGVAELAGAKAMVGGTDFYYADCLGFVGLYGLPVNKGFEVAPVVGTNASTVQIMVPVALMYDVTNKCFMGYAANLVTDEMGNLSPLQELNELGRIADELAVSGKIKAGVTGTAFGEFPQGLDYVYMENTKYDPGNGKMGVTYTVLADGAKRYVYGIQLGDLLTYGDCSAALGKAYYGDVSGCTDIARAECFAFSSLKNYMYYAVGGTVYRVDLSATPLRAERQFTLSGETVTCLKFNLYRKGANLSKSYDLVVGSEKGGAGFLRVYEGNESEGDFTGVKPALYEGFAKVVDAVYREMGY